MCSLFLRNQQWNHVLAKHWKPFFTCRNRKSVTEMLVMEVLPRAVTQNKSDMPVLKGRGQNTITLSADHSLSSLKSQDNSRYTAELLKHLDEILKRIISGLSQDYSLWSHPVPTETRVRPGWELALEPLSHPVWMDGEAHGVRWPRETLRHVIFLDWKKHCLRNGTNQIYLYWSY